MPLVPKWASQLAAVAILLAMTAGLYFWAVAPTVVAYTRTDEAIQQARSLLARYEQIAATRAELEAQQSELKELLATSGVYLRGSTHALAAAELQDRVTTTVKSSGGELRSTQILPVKKQGDFQRVAVRVQLTAKMESLYRILYTLEASTPIVFIDHLDVKSRLGRRTRNNDTAADDPDLTVRFDLSAYLQPDIG